ncbi:Calnexin [Dirofilaria immitis]|nr:Calnexin [Dirofilaria immitis]
MPDDWLEEEEPLIPDPEAVKPSDWDDNMDGEWEAPRVDNPKCKDRSGCGKWTKPMMDNPNYKVRKWKPPRIANPNYKGKWKPKQIENPNYFEPHPYSQLQPIIALGIELWTMSANIIFDNIYIGDDENAEAAYESASSPGQGIFSKLVSATEERPWLWVIYILSILIPIIITAIICFGRKSRPVTLDYKKLMKLCFTFLLKSHPDDEVPDLVGDDDESMECSSQEPEVHDDNAKEKKRTPSGSPSRSYIEKEASSGEEIRNGDHNSPKARRIRQRKQD